MELPKKWYRVYVQDNREKIEQVEPMALMIYDKYIRKIKEFYSYVYMYVCMYEYTWWERTLYVYMYICIYVYMYICVHVYTYICMHMHAYIICIHT